MVFAVGMDNGSMCLLRECSLNQQAGAASSLSAQATVTKTAADCEIICRLNLEEIAKASFAPSSSPQTGSGWMPLPMSPSKVGSGHRYLKLGAVTCVSFEARTFDAGRGTCRLAVGTAEGIVLVCEALKQGSFCCALGTDTKWTATILPPPPGLPDARQGGCVRTFDWSRCGRYLRACGDSGIKDPIVAKPDDGLKEAGSWIRVWSVGIGGQEEWERDMALALAEGGGAHQVFLHPLHLSLLRTVEWCSGQCLQRDPLFDTFLATSSSSSRLSAVGRDSDSTRLIKNAGSLGASHSTCVSRDQTGEQKKNRISPVVMHIPTDELRCLIGSIVVVGASDGSLTVLRSSNTRCPAGEAQPMTRIDAHSVPVGGVSVVGNHHVLTWGARQQFCMLWRMV